MYSVFNEKTKSRFSATRGLLEVSTSGGGETGSGKGKVIIMKLHICNLDGCEKRFETAEDRDEHETFTHHCTNCGLSTDKELTQENIHEECEWCQMERELNEHYGAGLLS